MAIILKKPIIIKETLNMAEYENFRLFINKLMEFLIFSNKDFPGDDHDI